MYQLLLISYEPANNIHQYFKQTGSDLSAYLWPSLQNQETFLVIETSFRVSIAVCAMARNEIEHIHAEPTYGFSAKPSVSLALFLNCLKARMWNTGTVILEKKRKCVRCRVKDVSSCTWDGCTHWYKKMDLQFNPKGETIHSKTIKSHTIRQIHTSTE